VTAEPSSWGEMVSTAQRPCSTALRFSWTSGTSVTTMQFRLLRRRTPNQTVLRTHRCFMASRKETNVRCTAFSHHDLLREHTIPTGLRLRAFYTEHSMLKHVLHVRHRSTYHGHLHKSSCTARLILAFGSAFLYLSTGSFGSLL
jgi:hypothetical protein